MKTDFYGTVKTVERKNFQFLVGMRNFSLLHNVQTRSRAHTATYIMVTRHYFIGVKLPGREAAVHLYLVLRLTTVELYPPLPIHHHRVVVNYAQG
jgi:hypothetical protein